MVGTGFEFWLGISKLVSNLLEAIGFAIALISYGMDYRTLCFIVFLNDFM